MRATARRLATRVRRASHDDVEAVTAAVRGGLPRAVLMVVIEVMVRHPKPQWAALAREITTFRAPEVRVRAFVAWAGMGPTHADAAVTRAADDFHPAVQRLAIALSRVYTSPAITEAIARLLDRNPELQPK